MTIVFGCIAPHPPLLVPEVGRGQEAAIAATTAAMRRLADALAASQPQTLVVISPHGRGHYDAMGVATATASRGDFRDWGVPRGLEFTFANDLEFVAALGDEAEAADVPLRAIGPRRGDYDLDWGVLVPLSFLARGLADVFVAPLTFSELPLPMHFAFGKAIQQAARRTGRRVAVVASGDMSHRLLAEGPYGYDPAGPAFDARLAELITANDVAGILGLDPELVERAGECGYRSAVILLGALDGLKTQPEVLSYEGPFGIGYLVASFAVVGDDPPTEHPLVALARRTVESHVVAGRPPEVGERTPEMEPRAGVFVSIKKSGDLRGCIGTFEPTCANIGDEIVQNAIASATRDPRFMPIAPAEMPYLSYSVDVLTSPEPVAGPEALDSRRYGVIVECGERRGLLLPDLDGVDSVAEQIAICRSKGGIAPDAPVKLYRFEVQRYT